MDSRRIPQHRVRVSSPATMYVTGHDNNSTQEQVSQTFKMPSPLESVAKGVRAKSKLISWKSFSWLWVLFTLVLFVGDGILMVFLGLDLMELGLSNPLVLLIWNFVLFVVFGVIAVISGVYFTQEELLEDGLRLPVLAGLWTIYNGVATLLFLIWSFNHPKLHSDVEFNDNPSAYASFMAVNAVCFLWFWVNIGSIVLAWVIHYNQRKYLETLNRSLQVTDHILMTYHGTTVYHLMTNSDNRSAAFGVDHPRKEEEEIHEHIQEGNPPVSSAFHSGTGSWKRTAAVMTSREEPVRGTVHASRPPRRLERKKNHVRFRGVDSED